MALVADVKSSDLLMCDRMLQERDHYARLTKEAAVKVDELMNQVDILQQENLALRQLIMNKEDQYVRDTSTLQAELGSIRSQMRTQVEKFHQEQYMSESDLRAHSERVMHQLIDQNLELEQKMKFLVRVTSAACPFPPSPLDAIEMRTDGGAAHREFRDSPPRTARGQKALSPAPKVSTVETSVAMERENKALRQALRDMKTANQTLADSLRELVTEIDNADLKDRVSTAQSIAQSAMDKSTALQRTLHRNSPKSARSSPVKRLEAATPKSSTKKPAAPANTTPAKSPSGKQATQKPVAAPAAAPQATQKPVTATAPAPVATAPAPAAAAAPAANDADAKTKEMYDKLMAATAAAPSSSSGSDSSE